MSSRALCPGSKSELVSDHRGRDERRDDSMGDMPQHGGRHRLSQGHDRIRRSRPAAARSRARDAARLCAALPQLRQGQPVRQISEGPGQLPELRRGAASQPHRRCAALLHDPDRRPFHHRRRARAGEGLRPADLGAPRHLAAADARRLAAGCCRASRGRSSACSGRSTCTASSRPSRHPASRRRRGR